MGALEQGPNAMMEHEADTVIGLLLKLATALDALHSDGMFDGLQKSETALLRVFFSESLKHFFRMQNILESASSFMISYPRRETYCYIHEVSGRLGGHEQREKEMWAISVSTQGFWLYYHELKKN